MNIHEKMVYNIFRVFRNRFDKLERKYAYIQWEKTKNSIPLEIKSYPKIKNKRGLIIGRNIRLGSQITLDASGGIIIGDNVTIGDNVRLLSIYKSSSVIEPIIIEDNVYIGDNSIICPGSYLPKDTVIDYMQIITKNEYFLKVPNLNYIKNRLKEKVVVFVVSTGRAGSKSIQQKLYSNEEIHTYHESLYMFLEPLALNYLNGKITKPEVEKQLLIYFSHLPQIREDGIYLESDQKLVPFIDFLKCIFPHSKFIWLVREPESFLKSAFARGWYLNDDPINYNDKFILQEMHPSRGLRVTGPLTNEFSEENWQELDRQSKILWYWNYWNGLIEKGFESINKNEKFTLKTNEINSRTKDLANFLGLEKIEGKSVHANKVKQKHKAEYQKFYVDIKAVKILQEAKKYYKNIN